jgi:hypothetical protein
MREQEEQLEQIEIDIETAKSHIERAEALQRLHSNPDFKRVILDGYFKDEASRVVLLKGDLNVQGKLEQKQIGRIITSIGGLRQYFGTIFQMGSMAHRAVEEHKAAREEILQEQLAEEGTLQ